MHAHRLVPYGTCGAFTPAIVTLCIASLGGGLLWAYLMALVLFVSLSVLWGTTAGHIAIRTRVRHSYVVAYLLGLLGCVVGQFSGFYTSQQFPPYKIMAFHPAGWFALLIVITAASGVLAQMLVLFCLSILRRFWRQWAR